MLNADNTMKTIQLPIPKQAEGKTKLLMPKTNLELTQEIYSNLGKKDLAAVFASLADDVEYVIPGSPDIPYAGVFNGKEGVGRFYKTLFDAVQLTSNEVKSMTPDGQKVIVLGAFTGIAKLTGKTFESKWVIIWTFVDGKVKQHQAFLDTNNIASALRK